MKRLADDIVLKKQLLSRYLWPGMGLDHGPDDALTVDFAALSHQYEAVKHEDVLQPGSHTEGIALWSERALLHSYYYCTDTLRNRGMRIYRRHKLIVDTESLLHGSERAEYLQTLERGGLMGITYPNLRTLMKVHPPLRDAIHRLHHENEQHYHMLSQYLLRAAPARIREFTASHQEIISRIPNAIQAIHIQVSEAEYYRLLKKTKK